MSENSKELEDAAETYATHTKYPLRCDGSDSLVYSDKYAAFLAGAAWQAKRVEDCLIEALEILSAHGGRFFWLKWSKEKALTKADKLRNK